MKILVIDNYDSFTYNLVQLLGKFGHELVIRRNDEITREDIAGIAPDKILISPGPGRPEESGATLTAIRYFAQKIPILGVCLGHQAIGLCFGATVVKAPSLMHGKTSEVLHDGRTIFRQLPRPFTAARYHSLIIGTEKLPDDLEISARTSDGIIMGIRHRQFPLEGIQFHPESILTKDGEQIIKNWLAL